MTHVYDAVGIFAISTYVSALCIGLLTLYNANMYCTMYKYNASSLQTVLSRKEYFDEVRLVK